MPGKLSNAVITKWWKAGQLFKHAGLLLCLELYRGELSPSIQKMWYLHSSSSINILYDPGLTVIPTKFSPPATLLNASFYTRMIVWISSKQNLTEYNVTCLLPFSSYSSVPAACHKNTRGFCESIFTSFCNQRAIGIYLGQQILRSKTCWCTLGSVARVVEGNAIRCSLQWIFVIQHFYEGSGKDPHLNCSLQYQDISTSPNREGLKSCEGGGHWADLLQHFLSLSLATTLWCSLVRQ